MLRSALTGVLLLALAGCATPQRQPYQPPQTEPTAQVSFRNTTSGRTEVALFKDAVECTGRQYLPDLLIGEEQSVLVPGGQALAFGIRYIVPNTTPPRYCEVLASFVTEADGRYEVIIHADDERPCAAHVRQLEGTATDLHSVRRVPVKSQSEDGPFCLAIQ